MGKPKVSVIMCAYNVEHYIDEAIQSVLAQIGASFELLIADDVSTDGTWSRIRAYQADPRIRTWQFQIHRSAAAVRNFLIDRSHADYLSICDADDVMMSGNLRRLAQALDRWPQIGVAYGERLTMSDTGRFLGKIEPFTGPDRGWDLLAMAAPHGGAMLRRIAIERVGGYQTRYELMEDYDLFLRLAEISRFRSVQGATYLRRKRPTSLSHSMPARKKNILMRAIQADAIRRRYGVVLKQRA